MNKDCKRKKRLKSYVNQISISEPSIRYDLLDKIDRGILTSTKEIMNEIRIIERKKKNLLEKREKERKERIEIERKERIERWKREEKKSLISYVDNLHILASGSSLNRPIKNELKKLIYEGKLLTESEIDMEKEKLIKKMVEELKKTHHPPTSGDSPSSSETFRGSYNGRPVIIPDHEYWKDMYH